MQDVNPQPSSTPATAETSRTGLNPAAHLDTSLWRHALIPWKEGGKPYTYLIPPGLECNAGYWAMVVKPNGTPSVFQVTEVQPHEPTTYQLKPIANAWTDEQWQEMVQASHPERPKISMNEDYPRWTTEAADLFVEGK